MKNAYIEPVVTCPYCRKQFFNSDKLFRGTGGQVVVECSCGKNFLTYIFSTASPGSYANIRSCFYNSGSHRWKPVEGKSIYKCKECGLLSKSPA